MPTFVQGRGLDVEPPQSQATLLGIISKLRQELADRNAEVKKISNNLNCLISLVKRSWTGDKTAILHLANIVGVPSPGDGFVFGHDATKANERKSGAVLLWERLSVRLLQREYSLIEEEIRRRQQQHLESRQLYMNDLMHNHQADMVHYGNKIRAKSARHVEEIDKRFLKTMKEKRRPPSGTKTKVNRCKSAGNLQHMREQSEKFDVTLRDLVAHPAGAASNPQISSAFSGILHCDSKRVEKGETVQYVAPNEENIFDPEPVLAATSSSRPQSMSGAARVNKQVLKKRPRSANANSAVTTEKKDLSLTSSAIKPRPPRTGSAGSSFRRNSWSVKRENENKSPDQVTPEWMPTASDSDERPVSTTVEDDLEHPTPEEIVQAKKEKLARATEMQEFINKAVKTPQSVNKFDQDLMNMSDMEMKFKQATMQLQRRLGLNAKGFLM